MRRVRATTLAAFANQDLPFVEVVSALQHERGVEPAALAQVDMVAERCVAAIIVLVRVAFEEVDPAMLTPPAAVSAFDIMLMLREGAQGIVGTCVYKPHLFAAETVDRMLGRFEQVLEQWSAAGATNFSNSRVFE